MESAGFPPSGMTSLITLEKLLFSPFITTLPNPDEVPKYNWLFEIASISMMPLSGKASFSISEFLSKVNDGGNENRIDMSIKKMNFIHNPQSKMHCSHKWMYNNYPHSQI